MRIRAECQAKGKGDDSMKIEQIVELQNEDHLTDCKDSVSSDLKIANIIWTGLPPTRALTVKESVAYGPSNQSSVPSKQRSSSSTWVMRKQMQTHSLV